MLPENSASYVGVWWLPSRPDFRVPGTLTVDPKEGLSLKTTGRLSGKTAPIEVKQSAYAVVHGAAAGADAVTLLGVVQSGNSWSASGVIIAEHWVRAVALGARLGSFQEIKLSGVQAEYTQLHEWLGFSGFKPDFAAEPEFVVTVTFRKPKPIIIHQSESVKWEIDWAVTLPGFQSTQREMGITAKPYLQITPSQPETFDELHQQVIQFQQLLSCLVGAPVSVTSLSGQMDKAEMKFSWRSFAEGRKAESVHPLHQMASYGDLKDDIRRLAAFFLQKHHDVAPLLGLWVLLRSQEDLNPEQRFLNHCQIAEAFHRRAVGGTEKSPEEHAKRMKAVLDAVPQDHRDWVEWRLSFSNEPSFRDRLKDLWARSDGLLAAMPMTTEDFIAGVSKARNDFTHYKFGSESVPQDVTLLDYYLETLVELSILGWLGVPKTLLVKKALMRIQQAPRVVNFGEG